MPHQNIKELYYNYNLVSNMTSIWCSVHIVHTDVVNHVWFFGKLHFNWVWHLQLIINCDS